MITFDCKMHEIMNYEKDKNILSALSRLLLFLEPNSQVTAIIDYVVKLGYN